MCETARSAAVAWLSSASRIGLPPGINKLVMSSRDGDKAMEFYLSFDELLGKTVSPVILIFLPIFLITTLVESC